MYANLMTKKIVMTKTEAKAAGKPDTTEYNTLLDLMKKPQLPVINIGVMKHLKIFQKYGRNGVSNAFLR